jgi:hypothetical protein
MEYNKNYTFALIILIGILAVGGGAYFVRKNASKSSTYQPTEQTTPSTDTSTTNTDTNKDTSLQVKSIPTTNQTPKKQDKLPIKICSGNGISITTPDQPAYECNTGDASVAVGGYGGGTVELSARYKKDPASTGGLVIVAIDKFSKSSFFNEVASVTEGSHSEYSLISSDYKISGVIGSYYTRENGDGLIIIPSKLIIISTKSASTLGIPQATLNLILSSITF